MMYLNIVFILSYILIWTQILPFVCSIYTPTMFYTLEFYRITFQCNFLEHIFTTPSREKCNFYDSLVVSFTFMQV